MKKSLYIFLHTALILLCTSCENMFNKMITYNGDEEPPVLCLNAEIVAGQQMKVYLTRSWFFLDTERFVGNPNNNVQRRGIVSDATVEIRINDGEWLALNYVAVPDTNLYGHKQEGKSYYTTAYYAKAGDIVTLRASHPDFKTVTATEIVPPKPMYSVLQHEPIDMVLPFTFNMDALPTATKDQIVFFSITAYGSIVDTMLWYSFDEGTYLSAMDSFIVADRQPVVVNRIYSEDFIFSEYDLPRTTHNYYTQSGPLYTSADHFVEPQNVTILLDCAKWSYNGRTTEDTLDIEVAEFDIDRSHRSATLDSVVINVRLSNQSFYMYRTTVYGKTSSSAPEISLYSDGQGGDDFGDIFEEIAELFSELGNQAGTQIYSNVENGFGHLSFINQNRVIIPLNIPIEINDTYYYE